jgi:hypothetical protein
MLQRQTRDVSVCRAIDAEDMKRQMRLSHGELDRWISKLRDTWCHVVRQTLPTVSVALDRGITASGFSILYK